MDSGGVGLLVAVVSGAVAFGVARAITSVLKKRRQARGEADALGQPSRQVRRAQARRNRR